MAAWNDGGLPKGSRKMKVYPPGAVDGAGSTTWAGATKGIYVAESWTPRRAQFVVRRYDEVRQPSGAFGLDDFVEGDIVMQLANVAAVLLDNGDAFTTARAIDATGGAVTPESFVIIDVSEPEEQGGVKKQTVRVQKIVSATGPTVYP